MTARARLPNRRFARTFDIEFADLRYKVTTGHFPDGSLAECFVANHRAGNAADVAARDAGILLSLCLQHGCNASTIARALSRNGDGSASGVVGAVLDRIIADDGGRTMTAPAPKAAPDARPVFILSLKPEPGVHAARARRHRPEQQIQRAVFQHLHQRGAPNVFAFHPANGGWRSAVEGAIFKALGVVAGVPDVVVIRDGVTYALELKSEGGHLSDSQRATHEAMIAAGAIVGVAIGLDEALRWLEGHGLLTGRTQSGGADDWRRFWQELAAAPTRAAAVDVFENHDRLFLGLNCAEREQRYAAVEDIVREKPDPKNSHSVVRLAPRPLRCRQAGRTFK
jgi:hypothetical protein